jgi:hypothetical protein
LSAARASVLNVSSLAAIVRTPLSLKFDEFGQVGSGSRG